MKRYLDLHATGRTPGGQLPTDTIGLHQHKCESQLCVGHADGRITEQRVVTSRQRLTAGCDTGRGRVARSSRKRRREPDAAATDVSLEVAHPAGDSTRAAAGKHSSNQTLEPGSPVNPCASA